LWDIRANRIQTAKLLAVATESAAIARATAHELERLRAELAQAISGAGAESSHRLAEAGGETARALDAYREELSSLRRELAEAEAAASSNHERTLLALRMVRDDDERARAALWSLRGTPEYERAFDEDEPLVSIIITTYTNWPLLRDRCLPSVIAQTYPHWEAIVVGDAAPDEARQVVESFGDARIRFVNLPYRGPYPEDPRDAWHMSGTGPWNTGLALARGSWIGANSDDDALRPNSIEALLQHARTTRAEVPYGCMDARTPDAPGQLVGVFPPVAGQWGMQASLLHAGLRFLPLQPSDWVFDVPNDVSLLDRMLRIGVRFSFLDEAVVDYYPSRLWSEREQRPFRREVF
jgi:Glycosyl transferase family 2